MKIDPLTQYAQLKQRLTEEKSRLETRLNDIKAVLGSPTSSSQLAQSVIPEAPRLVAAKRGRKPRGSNTMSLREAVFQALSQGPVARKDLVKAVEGVGYVFNTKNPLNSIGSVLYGKKSGIKSADGKFFLGGATPTVSAEARARMATAQKIRWATVKKH